MGVQQESQLSLPLFPEDGLRTTADSKCTALTGLSAPMLSIWHTLSQISLAIATKVGLLGATAKA